MHTEINQEALADHKKTFANTLLELNNPPVLTRADEAVQTDSTPAPAPAPKTQTVQPTDYTRALVKCAVEILSSAVLVSLVHDTYGYPGVLGLVLFVEGVSKLGQWAGALSPCRAASNTESVAAGCFLSGLAGGGLPRVATGVAAFMYADSEHKKVHPKKP